MFKFKPKRGYKRRTGHRQELTRIRVTSIGSSKRREDLMAHKKGLGSSRNGRDSNAKRLGVKVFAGQTVTGGEIIVRQRGTSSSPATAPASARTTRSTLALRAPSTSAEGRRGRVIPHPFQPAA